MGRLDSTPSVAVGILRPRRKHVVADAQEWRTQALCAGHGIPLIDPSGRLFILRLPEQLWHPQQGDSRSAGVARSICMACPVRVDCLARAVAGNEPLGIWGGCTERERRVVKAWLVDVCGVDWIGRVA